MPYWNVEMTFQSLRFKEFDKASGVRQLKSISALITKGTTPQNFVDKGINFIKIECFENNKIDTTKCYFIDETTHTKELKRSILADGDILFAIAGATIGKCNVVTKEVLPANTNQALAIIRLNKNECREFIYHLLRSPKMQRYIIDNIAVGAQPNLNLQQMGNFTFQYPDIEEQTKIANFLTSVDEKITQLTQKHDLLTQYKKGVMQQIFSQELRFKDDDGRDFPEWKDEALENLLDYEQPTKYLVSSTEYSDDYNTPVLTAGKTFILGYTNETNGICEQDLPVIIFDDFTTAFKFVPFPFKAKSSAMKILRKKAGVNISYIYSAMQLIDFPSGDEHKRYWISEYSKVTIPLPCQKEQTKIANFLTSIDDKINATQAQLDAVKQYKQGLLQQMFV